VSKPKPIQFSQIEIKTLLDALAGPIPADRPDLVSVLVRAKRKLRIEIHEIDDETAP
jgi:hypothetical protein